MKKVDLHNYTKHFNGPIGDQRPELAEEYLELINVAQRKINNLMASKLTKTLYAREEGSNEIQYWCKIRDSLISQLADPLKRDIKIALNIRLFEPETLKNICLAKVARKIGLFQTEILPTDLQEDLNKFSASFKNK